MSISSPTKPQGYGRNDTPVVQGYGESDTPVDSVERGRMLAHARERLEKSLFPNVKTVGVEIGTDITAPTVRRAGWLASATQAIPSPLAAGISPLFPSLAAAKTATSWIDPKKAEETADKLQRFGAAYGQAAAERDYETPGVIPPIVMRGLRGASRTVFRMLAVAAGTGPYGAIFDASQMEFDRAITEGRDKDLEGGELAAYATTQGVIEGSVAAVFQRVGLGGAESMAAMKGVAGAGIKDGLKRLGISTLQELPEEILTEVGHNVASAVFDVDPDALSSESLVQTIADTTVQTVITMGFVGAVHGAVARGGGAAEAAPQKLGDLTLEQFLTPEIAARFAAENSQAATEFAKSETPSRKQWEETYGFPRTRGEKQRKQFAGWVRDSLAKTEAPVEAEAVAEPVAPAEAKEPAAGEPARPAVEEPAPVQEPAPVVEEAAPVAPKPKVKSKGKKVEAKEPWQMTREEYDRARAESLGLSSEFSEENRIESGAFSPAEKRIWRQLNASSGTFTHELRHAISDAAEREWNELRNFDLPLEDARKASRLMGIDRNLGYGGLAYRREMKDELATRIARGDEKLAKEFPKLADIVRQNIDAFRPDVSLISHREQVQQALAEGKPVPAEVLAEYPDLAKPKPVQEPVVEAELAETADDLTSIKNAVVEQLRARRGLSALTSGEAQTFQGWLDAAGARMTKDPNWTPALLKELQTSPRAIDETEHAGLHLHYRQVYNHFNQAVQDLRTKRGGDPATMAQAETVVNLAAAQLAEIEQASRTAGTIAGRSLASRKIVLAADFSMAGLTLTGIAAKGGENLTAAETAKLDEQANRIAELEAQLAETKKPKSKGKKVSPRKPLTDTQKIAAAGRALDLAISRMEADLKAGRLGPKSKGKKLRSAALDAKRAQMEVLRAQREKLRAKDPEYQAAIEARQSATYKRSLLARLAKWKQRLATEDFGPRPKKKERVLSREQTDIMQEIEAVKAEVRAQERAWRRARMTKLEKTGLVAKDIILLHRAIRSGFDLSAPLRQGKLPLAAHPIMSAKSLPAMFAAGWSVKGAFAEEQEIANDANADLFTEAGLKITSEFGDITAQEEEAIGSWTKYIPVLAGSARAYSAFLNAMRVRLFNFMVEGMGGRDGTTLEQRKIIAQMANSMTGRAHLGSWEGAATNLAVVFWSPRLVVSRFHMLTGKSIRDSAGDPKLRKLMVREHARILIGFGAYYTIAALAWALWPDDDEEHKPTVTFDTNSSDFGKVKTGNTRIDPMGGMAQTTVVTSKVISGKKVTQAGVTIPLRGEGVPFGGQDVWDVMGNFLRSKFSPALATSIDIATGKNVVGESAWTPEYAVKAVSPMAMVDLYEAIQEEGFTKGTALGLLAIFGESIQVYQEGEAGQFASEAYRLKTARAKAKESGTKFKEAREWARVSRLRDLTTELRKMGKKSGQEAEVKKYILGVSRHGLRLKEEERYPNPLTAKDLPKDVQAVRDTHLAKAADTVSRPEKMTPGKDTTKQAKAAAAYLKEIGVSEAEVKKLLRAKLTRESIKKTRDKTTPRGMSKSAIDKRVKQLGWRTDL